MVKVIALFDELNRIKHPWVARLKRAMTVRRVVPVFAGMTE
jgi:hypothetical protein